MITNSEGRGFGTLVPTGQDLPSMLSKSPCTATRRISSAPPKMITSTTSAPHSAKGAGERPTLRLGLLCRFVGGDHRSPGPTAPGLDAGLEYGVGTGAGLSRPGHSLGRLQQVRLNLWAVEQGL